MTDTAARNPTGSARMMADALLRSMTGATALLRVTGANTDTNMLELGLAATPFAEVVVSPVVMRKLRPSWQEGGESKWELIVSATSVEQQVNALSLATAQSLFAMTLSVTVAEQDYLIESIASNEAFGQIYVYRLLLREARQQSV
jgi:hypothetical protein